MKRAQTRSAAATVISLVAVAVPGSMAYGQSGPRVQLDVTASAGAATNPYLQQGSEVAGVAYLAVDPTIYLEEGRNETVLQGGVRLAQYSNDYGSDVSGNAGLSSRRAISEQTSVTLFADAWSSRTRLTDLLATGAGDLSGVPTPGFDGIIVDPTVTGTRTRQTVLGVGAALEHRLDVRSSLDTGLSYTRTLTGGGVASDYDKAEAYLSYGRQLSANTTVSLRSQFATYEYDNSFAGDSRVYSLAGGVNTRLSQTWEWQAQVGVDVLDRLIGPAQRDQSVSLAGSAALCRTDSASSLCLSAQRSAQPTALAGVTTSTGVGASYSLRTSARDVLRINARYSRAGGDAGLAVVRSEVFGFSVGFTRHLSERTSLFAEGGYTGSSRTITGDQSDLSVRTGIRMRFGRF